MKFKTIGKVYTIGDRKEITDSFSKKELVLEAEENGYRKIYCIEFANDYIKNLATNLEIGDTVEVSGSAESREYTKKDGSQGYFTSFKGFGCHIKNKQAQPVEDVTGGRDLDQAIANDDPNDDLPF